MTEEEAKTKWCPFARSRIFASETIGNRPFPGTGPEDLPHAECLCFGSMCAAWRQSTGEFVNDGEADLPIPKGETNPPFSNCPEGFRVAHYGAASYKAVKDSRVVAHGFCGLAGTP